MTTSLTAEDFTDADVDRLHLLVTELLGNCRDLAAAHAPGGVWPDRDGDVIDEIERAKEVIETLARSLNGTLSALRRIDTDAPQRHSARSGPDRRPTGKLPRTEPQRYGESKLPPVSASKPRTRHGYFRKGDLCAA
ncbi:hypothetical protein [Streptomyces chartreusis]|uniref:hypothetical protein n=1 Tax=Streptomyces chartreusis TaxID=1969 RepID=UPI0038223CF9